MTRAVRQKVLMQTLKENVEPARIAASELAPKRTGRLAEREKIATVPSLSNADTATVRVGPARSAFYGFFINNGTIHVTADPFLTNADRATRQSILKRVAEDFKAAVEGA